MKYLNSFFLYLDPGTGSMLIQFIIAIAAGIAFYIGSIWGKIKSIIKQFKLRKDKNERKKFI